MKNSSGIFFILFFTLVAGRSFAQVDTSQQQPPPVPLTDTISGWQLVFANPNYGNGYYIGSLQFPSPDTGYGVAWNGSNQVLLRSTNSGLTWDSLPTPVPGGPLVFTTPLIGYGGSDPNTKVVWKTTDGGQSWVSHERNSLASGPIAFANQDTLLVFGDCCMARTTDAGETWKEIFAPSDVVKYGASFANSQVGFVVGDASPIPSHPTSPDAGYCQKTTDGGATWTQIYTGLTNKNLYCCQALDSNIVITGSGSEVERTLDGGNTWGAIPLFGYFQSISFANKAHGLIVGSDNHDHGMIYVTFDTGKTWQNQFITGAELLNRVIMLSDSIAWVCGGGNIYRTTVGGNFSSVTNQSYNFQIQVFPNPSTGIVNIQYQLPQAEQVSFRFYDVLGNTVGTINSGMQDAGLNQISFDGSRLVNEVYYFQLNTLHGSHSSSFVIEK